MKVLMIGVWFLLGLTVAVGEVEIPALFADGMVLQQGSPVPVWGWANEGERVVVRFRGQEKSALTKNGQWKVVLDPLVAGGPDTMEIEGYEPLVIKDVLVGEVWLASGQSNMEWTIAKTSHAEESLATANNPLMRVFHVEDWSKDTVQQDVKGTWLPSTAEAMARISAVAYLFGQEIQQTQKVPVGILLSVKGGTRAVNWTSQEVLDLNPEAKSHRANYNKRIASYPGELAHYAASGRTVRRPQSPTRRLPSGYFNGMINGLIPYGMRGVIWYQGETDSWNAEEYVQMFPDLIVDWRTRWNRGDFPFYYVQIASFNGKEGVEINYPHLRDVQLKTLDKLPNLGMAVAIDAGEELDIHPKDKRAVAHRLALLARNRTYGEEVVDTGPVVCGVAFFRQGGTGQF